MMFADSSVSAEVIRVRQITNRIITEAVHGRGHAVDERDARVAEIIGKVFMTDLLGWLGDQMTIEDLRQSLTCTVLVSLAGRDALPPDPAGPAAAAQPAASAPSADPAAS